MSHLAGYVCKDCKKHFPGVDDECDCAYSKKPDPVNHPSHYTSHPSGVECITITEHMSFTLGNAIKYIWRADLKNGTQDLEKAIWYLNRELEKRKKC